MSNILSVQGDFQKLIRLPTDITEAFTYMTDFNHVLPRLPDVERVMHFKDGRYRLIFSTDDGRNHKMGIVFDMRYELQPHNYVKIVSIPVSQQELADHRSSVNGPLFPGYFEGEIIFEERSQAVHVTYQVNLLVEIEIPRFLNFMPQNVLQKIGDGLMQLKMKNIGEGYGTSLSSGYGPWCSQKGKSLTKQL